MSFTFNLLPRLELYHQRIIIFVFRNPFLDTTLEVDARTRRDALLVQRVLIVSRYLAPTRRRRSARLAMEDDERYVGKHGYRAFAGRVERMRR